MPWGNMMNGQANMDTTILASSAAIIGAEIQELPNYESLHQTGSEKMQSGSENGQVGQEAQKALDATSIDLPITVEPVMSNEGEKILTTPTVAPEVQDKHTRKLPAGRGEVKPLTMKDAAPTSVRGYTIVSDSMKT